MTVIPKWVNISVKPLNFNQIFIATPQYTQRDIHTHHPEHQNVLVGRFFFAFGYSQAIFINSFIFYHLIPERGCKGGWGLEPMAHLTLGKRLQFIVGLT